MKKGTRKERVGETKIMNCGKKATITAYRGCCDMDVEFETGEVRTGISYGSFTAGSVLPIAITDALNQKIGEVRVMNNGMKAEIVACRTVKDIDVQFSDGTIKEHTTYSQFLSGKIANPNVNKRAGETRTMRNKVEATITAWRKHNDIDVTFSDGYVVYNTSVEKFERGTLENPNVQHARVGETNVMYNGLKATITEYRNSGDMDVEFEDGSIRKNVSYAHFKEGKISLKSVEEKFKKYAADRIGERKLMNCGQWCEITEYFSAHNITVKFDSGTVLKKKYYTDFSRGMIVDPNNKRETTERQRVAKKVKADKTNALRVGQRSLMRCGLYAEIVEYENFTNCKIRFDDGYEKSGVRYEMFLKGNVGHPDYKYDTSMSIQEYAIRYYLEPLGFVKIEQGQWESRGLGRKEIDFYHPEKNFAIEVDGDVHKSEQAKEKDLFKDKFCAENNILLYRLRSELLPELNSSSVCYKMERKKEVVAGLIDCKEILKAILSKHDLWNELLDIDFQRDAELLCREYSAEYCNKQHRERIGTKVFQKTVAQNMEVIEYFHHKNITVRFDDGVIVKNVAWNNFKLGNVKYPRDEWIKKYRIGQVRWHELTKQNMTVIGYIDSRKTTVQFDDGAIVENVRWENFEVSKVLYPKKKEES